MITTSWKVWEGEGISQMLIDEVPDERVGSGDRWERSTDIGPQWINRPTIANGRLVNDVVDCYGIYEEKVMEEIYVPKGNCLSRPRCCNLAIVSSHVDA